MEIVIPDVGHGNCVGIFVDDSALLVDCGAEDTKIQNFAKLIEQDIKRVEKRDIMITHYHHDHYNLISRFSEQFFDNVYVPSLPPERSTANAMLQFIALAIVTSYGKYYLVPQLLSVGKNIHPFIRGSTFTTIEEEWKVLWPDYKVIDTRNKKKIKTISQKIREIKSALDEEKRQKFEEWYNILSKSFSKKPNKQKQLRDILAEMPKSKKMDKGILKGLTTIEKIFKDIANRASLVARDDDFNFLFTGDIDDVILNHHLQFGNKNYFLIEAPHHGGYYGYAFDNTSTDILVISRKSKYKPRPEYFRELPWKILADTARIGNCILRRQSQVRDIQFISINDGEASALFALRLL